MKLGILLLLIHCIFCLAVYLLLRISILKSTRMIMPLVCLIPVWGFVCLVFLELRTRGKQEPWEEVGVEKLKINDEIHRSILKEEDPAENRIVPLEEALLINEPSARRELMMEIMYERPEAYVEQLKEARMNDDTEVVHYAVTALAELQKEYDLKFQELDWELEKDPENEEAKERYLKVLERYLASQLAEGNARLLKLRRYSEILEAKLDSEGEDLSLRVKKVNADLQIREYEAAWEGIGVILERWDRQETGYLLMIQYHAAVSDRAGIDRALAMIERKNIYLTPEGRAVVEFWKRS